MSCELQLSGRKLEQAAEGYRQGRVASRRTLCARRLHRDKHEPPGRDCGRVLQQARHGSRKARARSNGGGCRAGRSRPTPCGSNFMRLPTTLAISCVRWQRRSRSGLVRRKKLIKIGAKVMRHGRYVAFQMAEVAIPRQMFQEILRLIAELRPQPPPALA